MSDGSLNLNLIKKHNRFMLDYEEIVFFYE